ncbi:MAG: aminomethyl-transferring glycine dehydrogenase subunit GcvPB [Blastocatellia bacterium]|nr:aminomethyl-transferring glycine dehydrogenase subunit GcvPB [Blastocatellia bacterium]MCS7156533.1 aminomethyl-transferring glycine dehydrogenase subunit GcvPB [Blastocatellia bacterium]MCX7751726.1 aminomethyl-transferring glycine dehydrogenase subunit GcvPB [Blastocatellia bacterium]MDW8168827.1 aminomethyl-transferring glycine dehydrogenase subunit GcvPB [Acidobacteriota bacterium]MDW8257459.1 aminomethyl-transferring glycine dehydrogenase subunit GcvPB [Acidobacteriota bacterium]
MKETPCHVSRDEALIFERSRPGRTAYSVPPLDVPTVPLETWIEARFLRTEPVAGMPEVSEVDVVRHFTRLSRWNYAVDVGLYPLGSCTMKYNPKMNERVARLEGFAFHHPLTPEELSQGSLEVLKTLEELLCEITGMAAGCLQPAAGAHGELTGLLLIRACLEARGDARRKVLIPDSAHGTNPASAAICGYSVQTIPSNERGLIDLDALRRAADRDLAALMLTNPNTLGLFEEEIEEIVRIVHEAGGLVYMDGANMNALVGIARPGDMGVDVIHLNIHKTFSTPHGGGGPGAGPVLVTAELEPFLPVPRIVRRHDGRLALDYDRPHSIGRVRAFYGNFGVLVRGLSYILTMGPEGLREVAETAVLNANYLAHHLKDTYEIAYPGPVMHEVVFSDKRQRAYGVRNVDIAKRLIDYGFHPPTMSFPLIVPGALMVEPTETECREELDLFIAAMKAIDRECRENPELVRTAPHRTRLGRLDEVAAARHPVLRWRPEDSRARSAASPESAEKERVASPEP